MATHIHVQGEQAPRLVGFDTDEVARWAAGLMGLDPPSYTLVERERGSADGWTRRVRHRLDRSPGSPSVSPGFSAHGPSGRSAGH
jgi:hypothetical protein